MSIETHLASDHAVLRLTGDFETYAVGDFLAAVTAARESGRSLIVLNMRRVKFINSTAIGAMLRARKELKAAGGGLALARSSAFVREVFQKLGLAEVLRSYEEEEEAAEALRALSPAAQAGPVQAEEDSALLFRFYDQQKADLLGGRGVAAGEIALLDVEGITFSWTPRRAVAPGVLRKLFLPSTEMEIKFRLPLYSKSTYYVSAAAVSSLEIAGEQVRVRARFTGLDDEAARAVRQYVTDMSLVREEVERAKRATS